MFSSTPDDAHHYRKTSLAAWVGIGVNVLLCICKIAAGLLGGSVAVMADGFNNLSDAGSSALMLIGLRLSAQNPDKDHPFGHGRYEYLTGLLVAVAILLMGLELLKTSVKSILHPAIVPFSPLTLGALLLSIAAKSMLRIFYLRVSRETGSTAIRAASADSLSDAVATTGLLLGSLLGQLTGLPLDGYLSLIVSLGIVYTGYKTAKETINPLLGSPPDPETVKEIEQWVLSHNGILGVHDLILHDYGPGRKMVSLHAEVDADGDFRSMHDIIDNVERELEEKFGCPAVIHMDPIELHDPLTTDVREHLEERVKSLAPGCSVHDVRVVAGKSHTKVIFDLGVPPDSSITPEKAKTLMEKAVSEMGDGFCAAITVDQFYVEGT